MFECPVCGDANLKQAPYATWPPPSDEQVSPPYEDFLGEPSYGVCVRCGYEFGFDDNPGNAPGKSFSEYRSEWIQLGRPWLAPKYEAERNGAIQPVSDPPPGMASD